MDSSYKNNKDPGTGRSASARVRPDANNVYGSAGFACPAMTLGKPEYT
jgi:hypothetical protein